MRSGKEEMIRVESSRMAEKEKKNPLKQNFSELYAQTVKVHQFYLLIFHALNFYTLFFFFFYFDAILKSMYIKCYPSILV